MQVAFDDARERLDELAELVANRDVELVLNRDGHFDVALIDAKRLEYYKALDASMKETQSARADSPPSSTDIAPSDVRPVQEFLAVSADYYVTNSLISPRQTLERFRIECEMPLAGAADVSVRVGDELSHETFLASWNRFDDNKMGLGEFTLRCYCLARHGAAELPRIEGDYPETFTRVVLAIHEQSASVLDSPLLLLSASLDGSEWTINWSRAGFAHGIQTWHRSNAVPLDPLRLIWDVAAKLDGRSPTRRRD